MVKKVTNADAGTADIVGGDDWDAVADVINGTTSFANGVKMTVGKSLDFGARMSMFELDPSVGEGANSVHITSNNVSGGGPTVLSIYPNLPASITNGGTSSACYVFASDYGADFVNYELMQMQTIKLSATPGEGSAQYEIISYKGGTGYLHPIWIGMSGHNRMIFNTDGSINMSSMPLSNVKLGGIMDLDSNPLTNVAGIRGASASGVSIRGNPDATDATERNVTIQTLNAATDAFVNALTVTANGASPTVSATAITNTPIRKPNVSKVNTDSPYTVLATDEVIHANATSGALTVTLPTAVGCQGQTYTIKRTDVVGSTNLVTVATTSSQTISSAPNEYLCPGEFIRVISDNSNWHVIGRSQPSSTGYYFPTTAQDRRIVGGVFTNTALVTSTTSPANNTLWAMPIIVAKTTKFSTITFTVTTNAVCNARAGLYRDNGACYPGALIFDTGSIDCSTGTNKDTTITAGLQILPPGLYWVTWECDTANIQVRCVPGTGGLFGLLGNAATMSGNPPGYGYSVAHTFGALPDPYTGSATILTAQSSAAAPVPAVGLKPI